MINRLFIYGLSIPFFLSWHTLYSEPIITFFLKPYSPDAQEFYTGLQKLQKPGKIAKQLLRRHFNPLAGIFATYGGFLTFSNNYGQIIFPRRHATPSIYFLITTQVEPIALFSNTISHWELIPRVPAQAYCMYLEEDESTGITVWHVSQTELPDDNKIPFEAIILFMNPKYVVIPSGITQATPGSNLQLPDIYIKKGIDGVKNSLYVLTLNLFFRPPDTYYEKKSDRYEMLTE